MDGIAIGELGTRCAVSRDTIFYEREGLLPRPRRTPARMRSLPLCGVASTQASLMAA